MFYETMPILDIYKKRKRATSYVDDGAGSVCSNTSLEELVCKLRLVNSSEISSSSDSSCSSSLYLLLYGDSRQPCAKYELSLPQDDSSRPRYGGDGLRGLVKYSG